MRPDFRNVDLEVRSNVALKGLARGFGEEVSILYCDRETDLFLAAFELVGGRSSLEFRLKRFCSLIEQLPPTAIMLWKGAKSRTFDVGFESGNRGPHLAVSISRNTLARIAALNATLTMTVYPVST